MNPPDLYTTPLGVLLATAPDAVFPPDTGDAPRITVRGADGRSRSAAGLTVRDFAGLRAAHLRAVLRDRARRTVLTSTAWVVNAAEIVPSLDLVASVSDDEVTLWRQARVATGRIADEVSL